MLLNVLITLHLILLEEHKKKNRTHPPREEPEHIRSKLLNSFLLVVCYGIPPDYDQRFEAARERYAMTFQPETWESFIAQLVYERSTMNIVVSIFVQCEQLHYILI